MTKRKTYVGVAIFAAILMATAAGCGCSTTDTNENTAATVVEEVTEIVTDEQGATHIETATEIVTVPAAVDTSEKSKANSQSHAAESESSESEADTNENKNNNTSNSKPSSNSSSKTSSSASSNTSKNNSASSKTIDSSSKSSRSSSATGGTSKSSSSSTNGKTWHEAVYEDVFHPGETERVWVVDQAAYSYEEDVVDYQWRTFCNVCGADITVNCAEHMKNHALTDGGSGWHDDLVSVVVGTKTVNVPEKGHWETRLIKEGWMEHKLVREAGYY